MSSASAHHSLRPHLNLPRVEDVSRDEVQAEIEHKARVDEDVNLRLFSTQGRLECCAQGVDGKRFEVLVNLKSVMIWRKSGANMADALSPSAAAPQSSQGSAQQFLRFEAHSRQWRTAPEWDDYGYVELRGVEASRVSELRDCSASTGRQTG